MPVSCTRWIIFVCVLLAMTLSLTVNNIFYFCRANTAKPSRNKALKP